MALRGLIFTRQFPNPGQPHRGTFVVEQMVATATEVGWHVIAPVPWVPKALAGTLDRPYVRGGDIVAGVKVDRPRYAVLPRRRLYSTVGRSMAWAARGSFRRAVETCRPSFVHAHELYPSGAAAARLASDAGLPLVVSVHGSDLYSNLVCARWRRELIEVAHAASAIICVGSRLAEDTVDTLDADRAKVRVVPDCYDDQAYRYVERELPVGRPIRLLTVGRLVPEKGLDVLLHALAALVEEGYDVTLDIVGEGALCTELLVLSRRLGLEERVAFAGALPPQDLAREFAAADLYVQPSRREGFGLALVEAQATGLPVVATDSGGPSDIVTEDSGVLVAPDDVPALVSGLVEALARLSAFDGAAVAEDTRARFGRDAVGARLLGVYREVAGTEGRT